MDLVMEILKMLLPALLVSGITYYLVRAFLKDQERQRLLETRRQSIKSLTPVRLQAFERLTLLLERLVPDNMVLRVRRPEMTNHMLQQELLATIRREYDHNLTQQLYISPDTWLLVRSARESITQLINSCSEQVTPTDNSIELSKAILENYAKIPNTPIDLAIMAVKREIQQIF